jgi:hypothetical protein
MVIAQEILQERGGRIGMALVLPKALGELNSGARPVFARPAFHLIQIIVDAMVFR